MSMPRLAASLALALALAAPAQAAPAQAASPTRGRALANEQCARCHAVGRVGVSPNPKAPLFRDVMKKYRPGDLEEALAEGIMVGHRAPDMPEFSFSPNQIDDLVAYFARLKGK